MCSRHDHSVLTRNKLNSEQPATFTFLSSNGKGAAALAFCTSIDSDEAPAEVVRAHTRFLRGPSYGEGMPPSVRSRWLRW